MSGIETGPIVQLPRLCDLLLETNEGEDVHRGGIGGVWSYLETYGAGKIFFHLNYMLFKIIFSFCQWTNILSKLFIQTKINDRLWQDSNKVYIELLYLCKIDRLCSGLWNSPLFLIHPQWIQIPSGTSVLLSDFDSGKKLSSGQSLW